MFMGPDGQPIASAQDQARSVQGLAAQVVAGLRAMPKMRVHLDACHEHLRKKDIKPTGAQADTLAILKLVADFQDKAEKVYEEMRRRAALEGAETLRETTATDVEG